MSGVTASCTIDPDYFAGVGPIVCVRHQAGADWIIAHVIPFLRVALVTSQNMIEASAFPDWVSAPSAHNALRKTLFQKPNPTSQFKVIGPADEKVNVIRHNDVAADGDIVVRVGSFCETRERVVHGIGRQHALRR